MKNTVRTLLTAGMLIVAPMAAQAQQLSVAVRDQIDASLRTGDRAELDEIRRQIEEVRARGASSIGEPPQSLVRLDEAGVALADGRGVDAADRLARNGLINGEAGERRWAFTLPSNRNFGWRLDDLPSPRHPPPLWTWTLIDPSQLRLYVGAQAFAGVVAPLDGVRRGEEVAANWWGRVPSPGVYVQQTSAMARRLHRDDRLNASDILRLANVDAIIQIRAFDDVAYAFVITEAVQRVAPLGRPPRHDEPLMLEMARGAPPEGLLRRLYRDPAAIRATLAVYESMPRTARIRMADRLDTENYGAFAHTIDGAFDNRCARGAAVVAKPRVLLISEPDRSFTPYHLARFGNGRRLIDCYVFVHAPDVASAAAAAERVRGHRATTSMAGIWNPDGSLPGADAEQALANAAFGPSNADFSAASPDRLLDRLSEAGDYWHFAAHGVADWENAFGGYIQLSGEQRLVLHNVFSASPRKPPRLVVLSACESGVALSIVGRTMSMHSGLSYPSAFLSAGAMGVIASMWRVADDASALLMGRFYELHVGGSVDAPIALNQAQIWLRDSTEAELLAWIEARGAATGGEDQTALDWLVASVMTRAREEGDRVYANSYYWGGFSYFGA